MVATPNIKIDTSMIKEFKTPVSEYDNRNKYMRINSSNKIDYYGVHDVIKEIQRAGGIPDDPNESGNSRIDVWEANHIFKEGDVVIYNNSLFQCIVEETNKEAFDFYEWKMLAGYSKNSYFYHNPYEAITQIVLPEVVSDKTAFFVNVNNLLLQSNNYGLEEDKKTITFFEPIEPDTNIEVLVYGNMVIPTDVSNVVVKTFIPLYDGQTEFELNEIIQKKELITVNIENTVILNSEWDLDETRTKVILKNPVDQGTRVQISYFNNLTMKLGATFTPHLSRDEDITTTLSWTNDGGLINPEDSYIYDGVTFVPATSKTGINTTISWTNNGGMENPQDVIVSDGATFTPDVVKEGYQTTISWTNDGTYDNPETVVINDGIKFVPEVVKEGLNATISWSNDQGAENPQTVVIEDGATFTPHTTQDAHEATISFTNNKDLENPETISVYTNYAQRIVESFTATDGQSVFVASHDIYDKSVLSVNVGNTELTSAAYMLGEDKRTVTLVSGLSAGTLVDLKYFYNLNFGTEGITYIPAITENGNGYDLSWTNTGTQENPETISIKNGATFTPAITEVEKGYELSWTNNNELENPQTVTITSGVGITPKGVWSADTEYLFNDYVTFEDETATYGYIALAKVVPAGTALTDTTMWMEMYKIFKTYIAATITDWSE